MIKGNQEFVLIDEQKLAYETCLALTAQASAERKQVLIIKGAPAPGNQ